MHRLRRKILLQLIKYAIAFLLLASLIYYIQQVGVQKIWDQICSVGWYIVPIMLSTLAIHVAGSIAWKWCIAASEQNKVSLLKLIKYRIISEGVAIINPTNIIGGDALKYYYLKKDGVAKHVASYSVILSRLMLMYSQIILFILFLLGFLLINNYQNENILNSILKSLAIFILVGVTLLVIVRKMIQNNFLSRFGISKTFILRQVVLSKSFYSNKLNFFKVFCMSAIHWFFGAVELFFIIIALGGQIGLVEAILVDQGVVILKSLGAFVPAQIGVEEYALKTMLEFVQSPSVAIWISIAVLRRIKQVIWIILAAVLYLASQIPMLNKKQLHGNIIRHT